MNHKSGTTVGRLLEQSEHSLEDLRQIVQTGAAYLTKQSVMSLLLWRILGRLSYLEKQATAEHLLFKSTTEMMPYVSTRTPLRNLRLSSDGSRIYMPLVDAHIEAWEQAKVFAESL